jgi:uncharacterized protein with PQ loop repeat
MNERDLKIIPYTATSLSVVGRFIFMFALYRNKSTNSLSLLFCILSIISSGMWVYYSVKSHDTPMIMRSCTEISLLHRQKRNMRQTILKHNKNYIKCFYYIRYRNG